MILEIVLALLVGVILGTLTGLIPGIHINLVSAVLLSISAALVASGIPPLALVVFLVSVAITHTFIDFVPSIFLGAPDEADTALSILPGHEMLLNGRAFHAVVYTLYGSMAALGIILLFSPLFYFLLPVIYPYAERIMPVILIVSSFFLIYMEKSSRIWALVMFLLSGILGMVTLNLPVKETLLPLFTGLFGVASLITSMNKKQKIPNQIVSKIKNIKIKMRSFFKSASASVIASPLCSFLPGMGSGQAAVIGSSVIGDMSRKEFLVLLGSINTIVMGLSFITLYSIGKARTGVAAAVDSIMSLSSNDFFIITPAIITSGILAFFLAIFVAKLFSKSITMVNYRKLSVSVLVFLVLVNFIFSGWLGLCIMAVSTALGLLCIYSGVRRTHLMGCLVIPAIMLFML